MLELIKTYVLEPWQVIWSTPAPFFMSVATVGIITWTILRFIYARILDSKDAEIRSKDAEIKLLERFRSLADGASPEQLKKKINTLEQKASFGPPVGTSSIDLYVGADPWSETFVPLIHSLNEFWSLNGLTRIHNLYARLDGPEHRSFEWRLWVTRDFSSSREPIPVKTQVWTVPVDGRKTWSYFYLRDAPVNEFTFKPGDYKLALFAYDDDGKEFTIRSDIRFTLSEPQVAHIATKHGVYLSWNASENRYTPVLSDHVPAR